MLLTLERYKEAMETEKKMENKEIINWDQFGELCEKLALKVREDFEPDLVVGIVKAGVLPGAVIASLFRKDFYTIKLSRRKNDRIIHARPILFVPISDSVYGKKILLVDWITRSGETLKMARQEILNKQAREVKTCTLFTKPGGWQPDWSIHESEDLIVCPWNRSVIEEGKLVPHPDY